MLRARCQLQAGCENLRWMLEFSLVADLELFLLAYDYFASMNLLVHHAECYNKLLLLS